MKNKIIALLLAMVLLSSVLLSSCSGMSGLTSQYVSDAERAEHIVKLIGENKLITVEDYTLVPKADAAKDGLTNMAKVIDNANYALYLNFETTDIAIEDKTNELFYHSNPVNAKALSGGTTDEVKARIASPLALEAYDITNKRYEFNFIENCLEDARFQIVKMADNKIRIIYTIGNDPDKDLVPPVMTVDTYNWVISQLKEKNADQIDDIKTCYKEVTPTNLDLDTKERFLKLFPTLEYMTLYVSRTLNTRQKQLVKAAMITAGFTVEMLKAEMERAEYQGPERAVMFTIPVDIQLDEKGLLVNVDTSLILAPMKQKMYKMFLYRGLGADKALAGNDEYMIIPDGSGAIMPISGKLTTDVYTSKIYGADETFSPDLKLEKNTQVLSGFGIFDRGIKGGMMTILEDGSAQAFITARPLNKSNNPVASINYDLIYAERDYRTYAGGQGDSGSSTMFTSDNSGSGVVLSKEETIANFQVRYLFNPGGLTYSDYAKIYRDYLIEAGRMPSSPKNSSVTPFYVEFLGAIEKNESKFGIPVEVVRPLTDYNDVKQITEELVASGVKGINLKYTYWSNRGFFNTIYDTLDLLPEMGTKSELKGLVDYTKSNNIGFFPNAEFMYIYRDETFDGLNYQKDAARRLDMRLARINMRSIATGNMERVNNWYRTILSPDILPRIAESFKESFEKTVDNKQISFGLMGRNLNSNYKTERVVNRTKAMQYQVEAMNLFEGYEVLAEGGNDYTWNIASHIINMPQGSSEYLSTDGSIPFVQMVLHGYVDYAGSPFNSNADYNVAKLKSLETGSGVFFRWMAEDNNVFDNTNFTDFYSLNYKNTFDTAVSLYKEISSVLDKVANLPITKHQKSQSYYKLDHVGEIPMLQPEDEGYVDGVDTPAIIRTPVGNVFETTYGDKITIVVNYNSFDVELEDRTVVPANGYLEVQ